LRYMQLMVQHKIIRKSSSWKNKESFIDICQNCWESNSQPEKNTVYRSSQPLSYYHKYTTKVELCIVVVAVPLMLKFWKNS
jgi:hypothetical protein